MNFSGIEISGYEIHFSNSLKTISNTDANFLSLNIDKATKTRGDKQLYLITHFTKQTDCLPNLLLKLNVREQFLKNLKQKRPYSF